MGMKDYLEGVVAGRTKVNQEIVANMQTILNLLPNLNIEELVRSMLAKTNDVHMVIYLSSLIRSVVALHDLVDNKIRYNEEVELDGVGEEKEKEKEKEKVSEVDGEEKKEDDDKLLTAKKKKKKKKVLGFLPTLKKKKKKKKK